MLENDGLLAACDWGWIQARACALRNDHYGLRQSPQMEESRILTAHVLSELGAGRLRDEILDLIEERSGKTERSAERLPEGEDKVTFLNHLARQARSRRRQTRRSIARFRHSGRT